MNVNFEALQRLTQKLKQALIKRDSLINLGKSADREKELIERMNELAADDGDIGSALVDTARELQALRSNRSKQAERLSEAEDTIGKLKFLMSDILSQVDVDERPATLEDVGL